MAKKAQATSKAGAKAKAPAGAKKPGKAAASAKATVVSKAAKQKTPVKVVAKPVAKPAPLKKVVAVPPQKKPAVLSPEPEAKKPAPPVKKAPPLTKSEKAAQAAETAEKIKIDKSMTEEQAKWAEMYNKYRDAQAVNYDMKATFVASSAIQHKVLGWGWVVSNENDRLEVLFKDGKRMLISNYRG